MGPIQPVTHPKGCRFIVVLVDNYLRFAMAYPVEHKSDAANCIEDFVIKCKNTCGKDEKFCYLDCDQGTEFTSKKTKEVLDKYRAELRTVCPYTPQLNGLAERYNQTIQKITRALMYDSRLPPNAWDLALKAAVFIYNMTPHRTLNFKSPLLVLNPELKLRINQLRRFGCIAFTKVQGKQDTKFDKLSHRTVLVGYTDTGYLLLDPEDGKIYESRNVEFIESQVFGDIYKVNEIKNWTVTNDTINKETWLSNFEETADAEQVEEIKLPRKRGRPRKEEQKETSHEVKPVRNKIMTRRQTKAAVETTSSEVNTQDDSEALNAHQLQALLTTIRGEPKSYREAMSAPDADRWQEAVDKEREALDKNQVYEIVDRPSNQDKKVNILDSRWVFRRKENGTEYPVSRLSLVRAVLAITNR